MQDYAVISGGYITNVIRWDGTSPYTPPAGAIVMLLATALADGYEYAPVPPPVRRVWESAGDFWAEFTHAEQSLISSSSIPEIRALVVSLSVWQAEMWSDDQRVQAGFQTLIASGILTEARAHAILNPPGLLPS